MIRQHKIGLAIIGCIAVLGLAGAGVYLYRPVVSQSYEASPTGGGQLSDAGQELRIKQFAGGWGGPACLVAVEPRRTTAGSYAKVLIWTGQSYQEGAFFFIADGLAGPFPRQIFPSAAPAPGWIFSLSDLAPDELVVADWTEYRPGKILARLPRWEGTCPGGVEAWRQQERQRQRAYDERNAPQ